MAKSNEVAARWTEESRQHVEKVRAIAERCVASVPLDYKLESTLLIDYPDGWYELMAACDKDKDDKAYSEIFEAMKRADDPEERLALMLAWDEYVGGRLAALMMTYASCADALRERQRRESPQL